VFVMASAPGFDANNLGENWERLIEDPEAPLLNRAAQGLYPPGAVLGPFLWAQAVVEGALPRLPQDSAYRINGELLECAAEPAQEGWEGLISSGCPASVATIGDALGINQIRSLYQSLGLFSAPQLRLPAAEPIIPESLENPADLALGRGFKFSPLQIALAAAVYSAGGVRPGAHVALSVESPGGGWRVFPALQDINEVISPEVAQQVSQGLRSPKTRNWSVQAVAPSGEDNSVTWFVAATAADEGNPPLVVVVVLEEENPKAAVAIGQALLGKAE
jgi:cell division protein FtsI/penicillin-binding protein 2